MSDHILNIEIAMARPLSPEKRQALLSSAAELIATVGTGASTAKIAQAAGVSEGTLFTYFSTKDDLLNQLFVEIETDLAEVMLAPYPLESKARERFRLVWDRLIEWGLANPTWRKAMRQLKVSDRVTPESRRQCETMLRKARDIVEQSLAGHVVPGMAYFYIDTILFALADIVIDAIATNPSDHKMLQKAGLDLFWNGSAA